MLNFGNGNTEFPLLNSAVRAWSARSEKEKKKMTNELWQCHCRNREKKIVTIVAMALPKMGGKNVVPKSGRVKKKSVTFTIFSQ